MSVEISLFVVRTNGSHWRGGLTNGAVNNDAQATGCEILIIAHHYLDSLAQNWLTYEIRPGKW